MRRRTWITGALAGAAAAGLAVQIRLRRHALPEGPPSSSELAPNAWLHLRNDGTVVLRTGQTELGQGVHTALALIVAGELGVPLSQITVETASGHSAFDNPLMGRQRTAASASVRAWWLPLRRAAAQVRTMLVEEAAERWHVSPRDCRTADGFVAHPEGGESLSFASLTAAAARRSRPTKPRLRPDAEWRAPTDTARLDIRSKVTGAATYAGDIRLPGRLVGAVRRAPARGQRMLRMDDRAARALSGVAAVVPFAGGIGVLAADTWTARRAVGLLQVEWSDARVAEAADTPLPPPMGEVALALRTAPLLHAAIEPQSCSARWSSAACDIWTGTQDQSLARDAAAAAAGVDPALVRVHTLYAGGAFGRGVDTTIVTEAVTMARAVPDTLVSLQWTREEDFALDPVREASLHQLSGTLDARGRIALWQHHMIGGGGGGAAASAPYGAAKRTIEWRPLGGVLPPGLWRAVDGGPACFAIESLVDALARSAGRDALEFRRVHLEDTRATQVLTLLRTRSEWPTPRTPDAALGCALHQQGGSWCGTVAEVGRGPDGPEVRRLVAVVDGGRIIHPDGARAQIEGALLMGLSSALRERTGATPEAQPDIRTLREYGLLAIRNLPEIDIALVTSDAAPQGLGEVALPPVAPAIAAAWLSLTGERLDDLPFIGSSGAGLRPLQTGSTVNSPRRP